jgi:hypothetical protein
MDRGPSAELLGCWMAIRHNGDSRTTDIDLILPDTSEGHHDNEQQASPAAEAALLLWVMCCHLRVETRKDRESSVGQLIVAGEYTLFET